jgi:hypothetical protein
MQSLTTKMRTRANFFQKHAHMIQNVIEIDSLPVYRQSQYPQAQKGNAASGSSRG